MTDLNDFIRQCEDDLVLNRKLSAETIQLITELSAKHKALCKSIIDFITRPSIYVDSNVEDVVLSSEERVLVCRLIPLAFHLNTNEPVWSSDMLSQALLSANKINGITLYDIVSAFLEILEAYSIVLNRSVYHFCIDLSRELVVHYRERRHELAPLVINEVLDKLSSEAAIYLRYGLTGFKTPPPKLVLVTWLGLIDSQYFNVFIEENRYLFEEADYKQAFITDLLSHNIPLSTKRLILETFNLQATDE